jgi:hypothetical protein
MPVVGVEINTGRKSCSKIGCKLKNNDKCERAGRKMLAMLVARLLARLVARFLAMLVARLLAMLVVRVDKTTRRCKNVDWCLAIELR